MPSIWNQTLLFSYCRGKQGPAYETETKTLTSPQQTEIFLKNLSQSTAFYHTDYDSYCPIHKQQIQMEKKMFTVLMKTRLSLKQYKPKLISFTWKQPGNELKEIQQPMKSEK